MFDLVEMIADSHQETGIHPELVKGISDRLSETRHPSRDCLAPGRRITVGSYRAGRVSVRREQIEVPTEAIEQPFAAVCIVLYADLAPCRRVEMLDILHQAGVRRAEAERVDALADELIAGISELGEGVAADVDEPQRVAPACGIGIGLQAAFP